VTSKSKFVGVHDFSGQGWKVPHSKELVPVTKLEHTEFLVFQKFYR